ncbi:unnamed protein product [Rotaria sordida]|uniref:Uncharacterized protein n=1 Tax=Rotaria sordida TaxID=392033 RepID=A0A814ZNX4_9BILA|nr:unnamed protein product [Rotaria sordida]
MYRYEKRVKYYGHIENNDDIKDDSLVGEQNRKSLVRAFGDGLRQAQLDIQTSFTVDALAALNPDDDVKVVVTTPSKQTCHMQVINNRNGTWTVNYIPNEVGETYIDVFFGTELVCGSPFKVNVFDINQIHVSNIDSGTVGHLVKFHIDASEAGVGQLEIVIQDGRIPCDAISCGSFQFDATFLPNEPGRYTIDIKFNGLPIPGSPFSCYINDISRVTVSDSLTSGHIGLPLSFDIHHWDSNNYHNRTVPFDVVITAPSGRSVPFKRLQLNESITRIDYALNEIVILLMFMEIDTNNQQYLSQRFSFTEKSKQHLKLFQRHLLQYPNDNSTHRVDIRASNSGEKMDINGSPFALKAYDSNRLIVSDIPHLVTYNNPVEFTVDASKAGEGQLEVAINDGLVPNQVKALGNSKFLFTFIPKTNDPHLISIKFNGHQLPDFPKECQIFSTNDITTRGPGLSQALLGTQTWFTIETPHGSSDDTQVTVFTPTNEKLNPSTRFTSDGLRVDWMPSEVGTYNVHVTFAGNSVPGSPFRVKCYDPKKVVVTPPINDSAVRKPTRFLIDASRAGEGNLEISVNSAGRNIPNQVNPIGNSRFEVQFTPQEATLHYCNILFNGELVPGSPFGVNVMDTQRVVVFGKGLGSVPVNTPTSFTILTQNAGVGDLKCSVKGPDDHLIPCIMTKMDSNRYDVSYTPNCVGDFQIEVFHDNDPIDNNSYIARAFDINKVMIYDFPSSTVVDSPTFFIIDATDSGSGNLEIAVSINEKNIPNYVQNEGGARFRVKFIPDQSGTYYVHIKFNGIDLYGSPFTCNVFSSDFTFENYEYAPINKRTLFLIKPKLNSMFNPNIYVDIIAPSGNCIEGKIEEKSFNIYAIRFIPNEIGDHQIIFYNDKEKQLTITKYICQVYDVTKIHISDLPPAVSHRLYKFTINTTDAGNGNLSVKIKQDGNRITHDQTRIDTHIYEIAFIPETFDECIVTLSFNGDNNLGPLTIPIKTDLKQVHVSSIPPGIVGQPIIFTIDLDEAKPVSVLITESHGGRIVPHTITAVSNEKTHYQIKFTPNIARQHTVLITYDDQPTSTYHVDVFDINKIRVSSIENGTVGVPLVFSVDTHGAGEGHLEVTISDGQRTLPAELKSIQARKFDIGFLPEIHGKHSIAIAFNGIPVEGSPFEIHIRASSTSNKESIQEQEGEEEEEDIGDHEFLIGGQLEGTKVGELAWLICDSSLSDIYEDFEMFVTDPDQIIIKHTRIQDSGGRWRIEFEPIKSGTHQIQTSDNSTDDSPIILASMDILPANSRRIIEGERIIHPNVLNFIMVNSNNENLKIRLRRSNGDEVPIEIQRDSSEWKIYFTLTATDYYQFSFDDNNDEQIFDIHCVAEETDIFRNGGIEDITRLIVDHSKINGSDVNVIVKDPLAHTIPAAFYRNLSRDLIIEYVPTKLDIHEVFIRIQNNLLDICPMRIMSFGANTSFEPVLRVQVKEVLEHTFEGVTDNIDKLQIDISDPFERPLPFQRSKNECGELTIALSPVRVGTHWIRISNDDSKNFALLPIFAFDDDYVPLSPIITPSPEDKFLPEKQFKNSNNNNNNNQTTNDSFMPLLTGKDLRISSETSETRSSRVSSNASSQLPSPIKELRETTSPIIPKESHKISSKDARTSPEVHVLDITDLNDPGVYIVSKFSFKDVDNKFHITIYDADGKNINYKTEYLIDGRKRIFYEPTVIGPVEIHIAKDNEPIDGSPLIVHAFDPSSVYLIDFPDKIQIDTINRFVIDPTKAGKGSLKVAIKGPNNRSLPITVLKRSNGPHTIYVLFNRVPIPETPLRVFVESKDFIKASDEPIEEQSIIKSTETNEIGERGRSLFPKQHDQERARSLSSLTILDPVNSRLSKSNENIAQSTSQKHSTTSIEQQNRERITKSEDRHSSIPAVKPLTSSQIQQFNSIKEKFERQQPIDVVFDPRRYPFKVLLQQPYPIINVDVHFLIDLPHIAYVHVSINNIEVPIQAARRNDDTFLLKFRPTLAGDYSIVLKDYIEQPVPGCPFIFPVYNPSVVHFEPFNRLQAINDCHLICNVDQAGPGKLFVMTYSQIDENQFEPVLIPIQIQPLPSNHIRMSLSPLKVGTYRIYVAYRNIPVNAIIRSL